MAQFATMLDDGAVYAGDRILSADAVAEMGRDQVVTTLDPAPLHSYIYGLGWDTVKQRGLAAVGQIGWMTGGDTAAYHAALMLAPGAKAGVIVETVGYAISSTAAEDLAERIVLHALVDKGTLKKMPTVLGPTKLPTRTPTAAQIAAIVGVYGAGENTFRVTADARGGLTLSTLATGGWMPAPGTLTLRSDGAFWVPGREGDLAPRRDGLGSPIPRPARPVRVRPLPHRPPPQRADPAREAAHGCLGVPRREEWLTWMEIATSTNWGSPPWSSGSSRSRTWPGTSGMTSGGSGVTPLDPSTSDALGAMFLVIPTAQGRDLADIVFFPQGGEEVNGLDRQRGRAAQGVGAGPGGWPSSMNYDPDPRLRRVADGRDGIHARASPRQGPVEALRRGSHPPHVRRSWTHPWWTRRLALSCRFFGKAGATTRP